MYSTILMTLDGSKLAEAAIPHAAELAGGTAAKVVVLEVIESEAQLLPRALGEAYEDHESPEAYAKSLHFTLRQQAEKRVEAAAEALRSAGASDVEVVVRDGLPGNVILDVAHENGAGAVVMATRGHSGLGREVVGSVAEYVVRHAGDLAVVLVGPRTSTGG